MGRASKYPRAWRERAVRRVFEHGHEPPSPWATLTFVAEQLAGPTEVLRRWGRQAEREAGPRSGPTTTEQPRVKELAREQRERTRANEILRTAAALVAPAARDRRLQ